MLNPLVPGVRALLEPREGLIERWRKADLGEGRIWFHVSSVGELEQLRPALEILGKHGHSIVLSYFSSSVPRLVKDWSFVRHADYLPLDFEDEIDSLFEIIQPKLLVLNRYDLWPNHLQAARDRNIPVIVVNASTPPLGLLGDLSLWIRKSLFLSVDAWTFVDSVAASAWEPYVFDRVKGLVTGDPRVDRALYRVEQALAEGKAKSIISRWDKEAFCLVAGSTWPEDEEVLFAAWKRLDFARSLMLVPHEPDEAHLKKIERAAAASGLSYLRYSALVIDGRQRQADLLIVDQRGFLAEIYGAGNLAYVGGGFRRQIHSIVEPVAHGLPVAFGPNFYRSPEAAALTAAGSALALPRKGAEQKLAEWIKAMAQSKDARLRAEDPLKVFLQIHRGAGERVADFVETCLGMAPRATKLKD